MRNAALMSACRESAVPGRKRRKDGLFTTPPSANRVTQTKGKCYVRYKYRLEGEGAIQERPESIKERTVSRVVKVTGLIKSKADFDTNFHVHRLTIFLSGLEAPLLHRIDRLGVQSEAEAADNSNVARAAISVDNEPQNTSTLRLVPARLFGIFRIGSCDGLGSGNTSTNFVNTSADSASAAGAHTGTMSHANSAARAGTNTSA